MNLYDFITLLQPTFYIDQSTKNDLIQTMTTYTKHDTNERKDINAQSIATDSKRAAILIYIWGGISLAYNARIWGGRFQTGDNARIYLWQNFRSA